jgi:hypothetical protein
MHTVRPKTVILRSLSTAWRSIRSRYSHRMQVLPPGINFRRKASRTGAVVHSQADGFDSFKSVCSQRAANSCPTGFR